MREGIGDSTPQFLVRSLNVIALDVHYETIVRDFCSANQLSREQGPTSSVWTIVNSDGVITRCR